jgi:hypothetical protein
MILANIIHEKELVNHTKVDFVNYYNNPVEYDKVDKSLPTLYVGWSFMKMCNSGNEIIQNADILRKKIISNELYWEFSFEESNASHVKGVRLFINHAPRFYFQPKYGYINLDPVFFQIKDIQDLKDVLPKKIETCYNYKNEMMYVLSSGKISGINLKTYELFKFNINEVKQVLNDRTEFLHTDLEGRTYQELCDKFPDFAYLKRYVVVFLK